MSEFELGNTTTIVSRKRGLSQYEILRSVVRQDVLGSGNSVSSSSAGVEATSFTEGEVIVKANRVDNNANGLTRQEIEASIEDNINGKEGISDLVLLQSHVQKAKVARNRSKELLGELVAKQWPSLGARLQSRKT